MLDKEVKLKTLGEQERNLLKNKSPFILPDNPSEKGFNANQIKRTMYEPILLLFDWLKKQGLETAEIIELIKNAFNNLETKVHDRGVALELDETNGIIKLIGKDKSGNDIELSSIDLPTEKIIKNVYYDNATSELVFQFENANDVRVPIGDIFELDNYYTKTDTDNLFNNQQTQIDNIILENTQQQELIDNLEYENLRLTKQVKNLQASAEGSTFVYEEDSNVAYEKDVPSGASPYAILNKVGGMSYANESIYTGTFLENKTLATDGTLSKGTNRITTNEYIKVTSKSNLRVNAVVSDGGDVSLIICEYSNNSGTLVTRNSGVKLNVDYTLQPTTKYIKICFYRSGDSVNVYNILSNIKIYENYYEGIRNSAVTEINSNGANLLDLSEFNGSRNGVSWYTENGRIYFSGTTTASTFTTNIQFFLPKGTYTLKEFTNASVFDFYIQENESGNNRTLARCSLRMNGNINMEKMTFTTDKDWNCICYVYINLKDTNVNGMVVSPMLVKGSTAPTEFSEYKNIGVKTLPNAVTTLTDYGKGVQGRVDSVDYVYTNYIDFINKKYIRQVQEINLWELEWSFMNENDGANSRFRGVIKTTSNFNYSIVNVPLVFSKRYAFAKNGALWQHKQDNVGCFETKGMIAIYDSEFDGDLQAFTTYLQENQITCICPLETPIEEDISYLLKDVDEFIEVEELGSITFDNEYEQDVPSTITYQVKI